MSEYQCPHCKNIIYDEDALLCHFCGESLNRTSKGALGQVKGGRRKWLLALIILVIIGSFIVLMWR